METGEFEVLGSSKTEQANVRVISATNTNLPLAVENNEFRRDLLYRLNTMVIQLPPLRERIKDIAPLAQYFLQKFSHKYQKQSLELTHDAIKSLEYYSWPGNIRELSHAIERAVLLASDTKITPLQLHLDNAEPQLITEQVNDTQPLPLQTLDDTEKQLIQQAMKQTSGNISEAAKILGVSRNALYRRLEKFGINE